MKEEHLETTQASPTPIARILLAQVHWLALAVAVLLWGLHFFGVFLGPHPGQDDVASGIEKREQAFRDQVEGMSLNMIEETGRLDELVKKVAASYGPLRRPQLEPTGDLTYHPGVIDLKRQGAKNEILFLPPKDLRLEVEMGAISLTWIEDGDNNVDVYEWEILRSEGNGPWKLLTKVPGDQTTFSDSNLTAGVTYGYRLVAITRDRTVSMDARRTKPTPPRREAAASDIKITLVGGDVSKKTAIFAVEKWHNGAWSLRRFTVQIGSPVGQEDKGSGINYTTGRSLRDLKSEVVTETQKVQEVTFDEAGKVVVQGGQPVLEEVPVSEEFVVLTARLEGGFLPPRTLQNRQKR